MNVFHLVKVHFDRRKPEIDSQWIKDRLEFFKRHTLASLQNQSVRDFAIWLSCGCNMSVEDVRAVEEAMMTATSYTGRYFVTRSDQHEPSVHIRLHVPQSCDYVYVTRIDSDDLYSPDALQIARSCKPEGTKRVQASMFRRGYLHDLRTGETGVYHGSSTPFHTMMFPREVFCDPERYAAVDYGDHSVVNSRYQTTVLPDWNFTVLVHGRNFISDMTYGRERGKGFGVEREWTMDKFLNPPVVFDVDDFCDQWNCLPELDRLKEHYPDFRCTLFTIPQRTSASLVLEHVAATSRREWIEVAFHGSHHEPNEELKALPPHNLKAILESRQFVGYTKGFRPPGWYVTAEHVKVLNELGMWVAIHERDERTLGPLCQHGYYVCRPNRHGHYHTSGPGQRAHSLCHNGIAECLPEILNRWPRNQRFAKVSESLLRSV